MDHADSANADLVIDALVMAFERRRRTSGSSITRIVEPSVYTSLAFGNRAAELDITRSFSSTGDCYDNAAVEAVWATSKRELAWIHGRQTWPTRDLLRSVVFDYVGSFYNPQRTRNDSATVPLRTTKRCQ